MSNFSEIRKASHASVPPLIDGNSRALVLGSMLSPKSAQARFYYAHPQNRFWRVLAAVFGKPVPSSVDEQSELALESGIALWDVIAECDIVGANDNTIANVVYNDIAGLLDAHSNITRVFTTGGKAFELLGKYNKLHTHPIIAEATALPSTSPRNCKISLDELITAYSALKY